MSYGRGASSILWLVLGVIAAGSMAYYTMHIWSVGQPEHFNDLYARWWGAHELFLHHRNPYSPEVAHEIQQVIYGAVSEPSADDPLAIGGGFAYPPYVALLLWPTVYLSFAATQKLMLAIFLLAVFLSVALWMRMLQFPASPLLWITVAVFTFGSFPALQGLELLNLGVLAAMLIAFAIFLLAADHLILSGIVLALATFKPQYLIVLVPWLLLWTVAAWRRRQALAWSFTGAMLFLVLVSQWLVPGWMGAFLNVMSAYRHYTYGHSLLDIWFTPKWGVPIGVCVVLLCLCFCWKHRAQPADSILFIFATSFLLAVTLVTIPTLAPHAQLLLLPGFLSLLRTQGQDHDERQFRKLFPVAAWALLAWPWVAATGLLLAATRLSAPTLLRYWAIPLYTSPLLPLALAITLASILHNRSEIPMGTQDALAEP